MVGTKKDPKPKFTLPFETVGFLGDENWRDTFGSTSGTRTPSQVSGTSGQSSRTRTPRNLEEAMAKLYGSVEANRQRIADREKEEEGQKYGKIPFTSRDDPGAVLFYRKYMRLTEKETNTHALTETVRSLREYKLHQNLDNLTREYLRPLIGALKRSKELVGIQLFCDAEKKELKRVAHVMKRTGLNKPNRNLIERSRSKMEQIRDRTEIQRRDPSVALARSVASSMKVTQVLTSLELHGIPFTLVGMEALAEGFAENVSVQHFSLADCGIGDRNMKPLLNTFKEHRLPTSLSLRGNNLSDETGTLLARVIRKWVSRRAINEWESSLRGRDRSEGSKGLRSLDLSQNDLTDHSLELLSRACFHDSWMTSLDLRRNRFGKVGGKALADMLAENRSLLSLKVGGNRLGTSTMEAIKKAIARNQAEAKEANALRSVLKSSKGDVPAVDKETGNPIFSAADLFNSPSPGSARRDDSHHHEGSSTASTGVPASELRKSFAKHDAMLAERGKSGRRRGGRRKAPMTKAERAEARLRSAANYVGVDRISDMDLADGDGSESSPHVQKKVPLAQRRRRLSQGYSDDDAAVRAGGASDGSDGSDDAYDTRMNSLPAHEQRRYLLSKNATLREELRTERNNNFRTESLVFSLVAANRQLTERVSALEEGRELPSDGGDGEAATTKRKLAEAQALNLELLEYLEGAFARFHQFVDQVEGKVTPSSIAWPQRDGSAGDRTSDDAGASRQTGALPSGTGIAAGVDKDVQHAIASRMSEMFGSSA